jgi:hypothetical protein
MTSNSTTEDLNDIIGTIHEWRRQISDHFGGNLAAMVEDVNRRTVLSGRRILRRGELTNTPMQRSDSGLAADTTQTTPVAT